MRRHVNESGVLTAEQRRGELARLLAAGVLRLRKRAAPAAAPGGRAGTEKSTESVADGLEVLGGTRLSVHTG